MASGMGIVISNRILGMNKLIANGVNGYVCNPDKEEFLSAIQNYIDHPRLLKEHALINRGKVRPLNISSTATLFAKLIESKVMCNTF